MWQQETIPQEFKDASIMHKHKWNRQSCENYRGVSLFSIACKTLARILHNRLPLHLDRGLLPESQCGFRKERGTTDMVLAARQLQEKCQQNADFQSRLQAKTKVLTDIIRDFLFADDCAFNAGSEADLQRSIVKFSDACNDFCLTISIKKTEVMHQKAPGKPYVEPNVTANGQRLNVVNRFTYLGSRCPRTLSSTTKSTPGSRKSAFGRLHAKVWNRRDINLQNKLKVIALTVLLAWTGLVRGTGTRASLLTNTMKFALVAALTVLLAWAGLVRGIGEDLAMDMLVACQDHLLITRDSVNVCKQGTRHRVPRRVNTSSEGSAAGDVALLVQTPTIFPTSLVVDINHEVGYAADYRCVKVRLTLLSGFRVHFDHSDVIGKPRSCTATERSDCTDYVDANKVVSHDPLAADYRCVKVRLTLLSGFRVHFDHSDVMGKPRSCTAIERSDCTDYVDANKVVSHDPLALAKVFALKTPLCVMLNAQNIVRLPKYSPSELLEPWLAEPQAVVESQLRQLSDSVSTNTEKRLHVDGDLTTLTKKAASTPVSLTQKH
ncbi:hypothetical protein LSAT2_007705 [Lamellibrachia satsuma]|nr:hypothetical protein LSAT2_007705 [Lamellibrachia satsuma]